MGIGNDGDGTTPIQTNLVYDDLKAYYAGEEKIVVEYANAFNQWMKANGDTSLLSPYVKQRIILRGYAFSSKYRFRTEHGNPARAALGTEAAGHNGPKR